MKECNLWASLSWADVIWEGWVYFYTDSLSSRLLQFYRPQSICDIAWSMTTHICPQTTKCQKNFQHLSCHWFLPQCGPGVVNDPIRLQGFCPIEEVYSSYFQKRCSNRSLQSAPIHTNSFFIQQPSWCSTATRWRL